MRCQAQRLKFFQVVSITADKFLMKVFFISIMLFISSYTFALNCDCEIRIYSPITGSLNKLPNTFKTYDLESFSSYHLKNQLSCRQLCLKKFEEDMPSDRLNSLLTTYAQNLVSEKLVGYNCTGLTTLKLPVRVKASLGRLGLGNVIDTMMVVNYEKLCF